MLENFTKKQWNKEGKGNLSPKSGAANYFYLLKTHFWKFVHLNFLFLFFSIPIVTVPGALVSLNKVSIVLILERNVHLWTVFWEEFKLNFIKSIPLGLLFFALLFSSYYLLSLGVYNEVVINGIIFSALGLLLLLLAMLWGSYTFILQAMLELPNKSILKNAFIMIMVDLKHASWSFLAMLISGLIVFLLFPISIVIILFCMISLTQYTLCYFVNAPVQKWIIEPYEASKLAR